MGFACAPSLPTGVKQRSHSRLPFGESLEQKVCHLVPPGPVLSTAPALVRLGEPLLPRHLGLTSWRRLQREPMSSGREVTLLLLAMRILRGRRQRQAGRQVSWFRLLERQKSWQKGASTLGSLRPASPSFRRGPAPTTH